MGKKKKAPPSAPSKAYLVSFGDTMTALLAFFIVINSMAQEQTGANMYAGTGSFVNAVNSVGFSGTSPNSQSRYVARKTAPVPLYALAENMEKNPITDENLGPDDEHDNERKIDRDIENFQRALNEIDRQFALTRKAMVGNQVVFDSFEAFKTAEYKNRTNNKDILSDHALEVFSEIAPSIRDEKKFIEVIIWATMPSPVVIEKTLNQSTKIIDEIQTKFNIREKDKPRLRIMVKPWLFSDAKRPIISFVVGNYIKSPYSKAE